MYSPTEPGVPFAITPSDTVDMTAASRAIVIAEGGDIKVTGIDGVTETYTYPAGCYAIRVNRVWATGTTATGISGIK